MSYVLAERVKQKCSVIGTSANITLGNSILGFRNFTDVAAYGDVFHYMVINITNGEWESGLGTLISPVLITGDPMISRQAMSSSNGGASVNFTGGEKEVFIALLSENVIHADNNNKIKLGDTYLSLSNINEFPADGDPGQVLSIDQAGNYDWVDQTGGTGGGSSIIKTFNVLNDFTSPLEGKAIYIPEALKTVKSVIVANSTIVGTDLMAGLYRNDALLQFFTIPAGQIKAVYTGLNYTINTNDYIKVSMVAGSGSNFTLTLLST